MNDVVKLLDNDWSVMLFRNDLGSYTAVAIMPEQSVHDAMQCDSQITDDFTVEKVLFRLTEKCLCGRIVGSD